jgi:hypothetical protein
MPITIHHPFYGSGIIQRLLRSVLTEAPIALVRWDDTKYHTATNWISLEDDGIVAPWARIMAQLSK